MLIGISGKKGSGKDTLAKAFMIKKSCEISFFTKRLPKNNSYLEDFTVDELEDYSGWKIKKFATALKDICEIVSGENFHSDDIKLNTFKHLKSGGVSISNREALQYIGTDLFRNSFPNIWVDTLLKDYKETSNWIVTDVRFLNEAEAIKKLGGTLIRIERQQEKDSASEHISETELDNYVFDYTINNDSDYINLYKQILNI